MTNTMRTMLLAAMLTGCTSAKPIVLPNGSTGQMIECDGTANSMASCIEKAGEICPKGYTVQDSDEQRGVMSGMLNLSRNLGLITGASVMGAVFAFAAATTDITTARPEAVARGMRITFAVATALILVALAIVAAAYRRTRRDRGQSPMAMEPR